MVIGRNSAALALLFVISALLAGCGGSGGNGTVNPLSPSPVGTSADLRGGWLIAGALPSSNSFVNSPFGLALNLDIINGQVTGYGSLQLPCNSSPSSGGVGGGLVLASATIAPDGTFTLTDTLSRAQTQHQLVIQGKLPATSDAAWSGTYTAAAPQANCNGIVPPSQTGTFTAQKIADLNGTFAGHGMLINSSSSAVTFAATLTQGGPASLNGLTTALNDQSVLNGTLQVQGIPCFQTGTMQVTHGYPEGRLTGNRAGMTFLMDDNSTVFLEGTEGDLDASTLTFVNLLVMGGKCDHTFMLLTTATKQ